MRLVAATILLGAVAAQAAEPRGWLGVAALPAKEIPKLPDGLATYPSALEVVVVYPGSPGEAAGLVVSDVILALDGEPFDPKDGDPAAQFRKRLMGRRPGESVEILLLHAAVTTTIARDGRPVADPDEITSDLAGAMDALPAGAMLELSVRRDTELRRVPVVLAIHPDDRPPRRDVPSNTRIHPDLAGHESDLARIEGLAVEHFGWTADGMDLRERLARIAATDDGFLLDDVRFVLREPLSIPEASTRLLDALAPRTNPLDIPARIRAAAALDRVDLSSRGFPPLPRGVPAERHVDALAALLTETAALREAAFAPLPAGDRAFLAANASGLVALGDTIYLHQDGNAARRKRNLRLLDVAARIDRAPLYAAALSWARLADPAWLAALRADLSKDERASKDYILRRDTPQGEIVLGGSGRNRYRGFEPAIVIDLGGDDIHANNAGSSSWNARPCAAVIDLAGDDAYEATESFVQGSGIGGLGLLIDLAGNDTHVAGDFAQAAAILGVGIVVDLAGDDHWRARRFAQGCGLWGLGLLLDRSGNDRYESPGLAQGLGLPGGFGIVQDMAGDDRWYAKGGPPTGYGTQGVYDGWAQGCGLGFRQLQSGGIGVLADDGGRDVMEAGNFAQGGGYFRGWGLVRASGRDDDSYIGSRYNQGFAAHAALGTFIEEGGDDSYVTRDGVIAGLAWDECVTYFLDAGGNDTYVANYFSLGASAHNAVSLFVDAGGRDRYEGQQVARAGGNDYHGGTSFSLFLDVGPGRDTYEGIFASGMIETNGEHGVAIDLPGTLRHLASGGLARALSKKGTGPFSGPPAVQ